MGEAKKTMDIYQKKSRWKIWLGITGALLVAASMLYTNQLVKKLADEERKKVSLWLLAQEQFVQANDNTDFTLIGEVLASNTTIPLILMNDRNKIDGVKNMGEPSDTVADPLQAEKDFLQKNEKKILAEVEALKAEGQPPLRSGSQKVYYKHSTLLTQLQYYPIVQLALIAIFILIGYAGFNTARRGEQNRVWVGMAKETAHQLGTPISAIIAWIEHLRSLHTDAPPTQEILDELTNDVGKLELIAERFSKIGASPELQPVNIYDELEKCRAYMQRRAARRIAFDFPNPATARPLTAQLNPPLFEWVMENLLRNALDAMDGTGIISAKVYGEEKWVCIEISDTGKGIVPSKLKTVFQPGYTTKPRGWGLGLSLAHRIIKQYHGGKIFVKKSVLQEGTTFCIKLKKAKLPNYL